MIRFITPAVNTGAHFAGAIIEEGAAYGVAEILLSHGYLAHLVAGFVVILLYRRRRHVPADRPPYMAEPAWSGE